MLTRSWSRRSVAVVAAALAATAATTAAWAVTTQDEGATAVDTALATAMEAPTTAVAAVPDEARDRFAVFRNRPATRLPADVEVMAGSSARFGRNPALARAITTVTGTGWVIPGDGFLCLVVKDPGDGYASSCVPTTVAVRQGLRLQLYGAFPDGQVAATVVLPDGAEAVGPDGTAIAARDGVASLMTPGVDQLEVQP